MRLDSNQSMVQLMLLSVVEAAINQALSSDPVSLATLSEFHGKVVRIKTVAPYLSLYILICEDGVHIHYQHDGAVDARVRAPAASLAWYIFGPPKVDVSRDENLITVAGDRYLVDKLAAVAQEFNIWLSVQRILEEWLPQYETFDELWRSLKNRDPIWVERLQYLPQMLNDALVQLRRNGDMQERQLDEMKAIRSSLASQQRFHTRIMMVGSVAVVVGLLSVAGYVRLPWQHPPPIDADMQVTSVDASTSPATTEQENNVKGD